MGVELELQILDLNDFELSPSASDLLYWVSRQKTVPGKFVPEITQGMLEINTGIHDNHRNLLHELHDIRDFAQQGARALNLGLSGGGTHPFQQWESNRISDGERYGFVSDLYGYLAKQFTVFGQHIHIGCPSGDDALRLLHSLSAYVPHFIALSAASPFIVGRDTFFASARLNSVLAFPMSGRAPVVKTWEEFVGYFESMRQTGIVNSMKDFYWDIRPKPEFGTIELRVCDTPLTVDHAADLAAYLQALCLYLLSDKSLVPHEDDYRVYNFNRFQAARFALDGVLVDPKTGERQVIANHLLETLARIEDHASDLKADAACLRLKQRVLNHNTDADWCRHIYREQLSFPELMRAQAERWANTMQNP